LQAWFLENGRDVPELVTADKLLASWQNVLQATTGRAPRGKGGT
jgi:hypothetical protein